MRYPLRTLTAVVVLASQALLAHAAETRTWSDSTGKHKVEAELVSVSDGKVWLKKSNGSVISLPLSRLSKADQEFLKGGTDDPVGDDSTYKVGDQAYLRVKGQWQLGKVASLDKTSAGTRYHVQLLTGSRRKLRVTGERLRRYGKAGAGGLLLPGDVVEIVDRWKPDEIKRGTIVSVKGTRAYVKAEGELAEKSYWLKDLRPPGAAEGATLAGRVKSAQESNRRPGQAKHPSDSVAYPDAPTLVEVNLSAAAPVELSASASTPTSIQLDTRADGVDLGSIRPLPISLIPKQNSWDKLASFSVSRNGDLAAMLRKTYSKHWQLELAPLRKSRAKTKLLGLLPETTIIELSPEANYLMTQRTKPVAIDIWAIRWASNERKDVAGIEHRISWSPDPTADSWFKLTKAGWLDEQTLMTVDGKNTVIAWDISSGQPTRQIKLDRNHAFLQGTPYLVVNRGKLGVSVLDLNTMRLMAVIGKDRALAGKPSLSPSGRWLVLSGSHGILEFWDLATGEKKLQTCIAMPDGGHSSWGATWSSEEEYLKYGNRLLSVTTWSQEPSSRLAKRSPTGVEWSFGTGRKREPTLTATKTLRPKSEDLQPNFNPPMLLESGGSLALDLKVDSAIALATRDQLTEMIEEQGFRVANDSRFVIQASTSTKSESREFGKGHFAREGDKGNFTVSYQVKQYRLDFKLDGQILWSNTSARSPSIMTGMTTEENIRAEASKQVPWDAQAFPKLTLPETVIMAGSGN